MRGRQAGHWGLLAVLALALGGCSSDSHGKPVVDEGSPSQGIPGNLFLNDGFNGTLTEYFGTPSLSLGDANCAVYHAEDVTRIHAGYFRVEWSATNELHRELRAVATDFPSGFFVEQVGPSPLNVSLEGLDVSRTLQLFVDVPAEPGAMLRQPVALHWQFSYDGKPGAEYVAGGCG